MARAHDYPIAISSTLQRYLQVPFHQLDLPVAINGFSAGDADPLRKKGRVFTIRQGQAGLTAGRVEREGQEQIRQGVEGTRRHT